MLVERVQIEEGFLDGLDVSFVKGLNVIVGERGTGKTSLIELMRFCLGVEGFTTQSSKRSNDHALSVLGSGQVTVTLSDKDRQILVSRTAADKAPRATELFDPPIVFSQTEIETVGLQAQGRLSLLDSFVRGKLSDCDEAPAVSAVRSITSEIDTLRREVDQLSAQVEEIPVLDAQLAELAPKEEELATVSVEAQEKKSKLDSLAKNISEMAICESTLGRYERVIEKWMASITTVASSAPSIDSWPKDAGPNSLREAQEALGRAKAHLNDAIEEVSQVATHIDEQLRVARATKLELEGNARQLRKEADSLQAGAGEIVRQGQQLRERKAQLESLNTIIGDAQASIEKLLAERERALDQLDKIREKRFRSRDQTATDLTGVLGPRIRVRATRAGQFEQYAAAIADVLRGSGLRYNDLAPQLAERVSPRELLDAAERNDSEFIAEAVGISRDRAARVLTHLREGDLGALATAEVDDTVSFQLLDGTDYKGIGGLSTGQRCTVILPLVLRHTDRVLIVDQPEDHIDNAFIAETLIRSVLARDAGGQIIFSTHNANIPVLGNADRVVQLASDGKRGFPVLAADLDDPRVVNAIETIMEGGEEAFNRRASFYEAHADK